jgi:hypothetical protein
MKTLIVCVLLVLVATTAALAVPAYPNVNLIMRGNVAVAAPTLSNAWSANPAALAPTGLVANSNEAAGNWKHEVSGAVKLSGDGTFWGVGWGSKQYNSKWGVGAGYTDMGNATTFGAGVGYAFKDLGAGLNVANYDPKVGDSGVTFDLGIGGPIHLEDAKLNYGVVVRDVLDKFDTSVDAGAWATLKDGFGVGADWVSISKGDVLRVGATYAVPKYPVLVGVGLDDGNFTAGASYDFGKQESGSLSAGLAYAQGDFDNMWVVGATYSFGD